MSLSADSSVSSFPVVTLTPSPQLASLPSNSTPSSPPNPLYLSDVEFRIRPNMKKRKSDSMCDDAAEELRLRLSMVHPQPADSEPSSAQISNSHSSIHSSPDRLSLNASPLPSHSPSRQFSGVRSLSVRPSHSSHVPSHTNNPFGINPNLTLPNLTDSLDTPPDPFIPPVASLTASVMFDSSSSALPPMQDSKPTITHSNSYSHPASFAAPAPVTTMKRQKSELTVQAGGADSHMLLISPEPEESRRPSFDFHSGATSPSIAASPSIHALPVPSGSHLSTLDALALVHAQASRRLNSSLSSNNGSMNSSFSLRVRTNSESFNFSDFDPSISPAAASHSNSFQFPLPAYRGSYLAPHSHSNSLSIPTQPYISLADTIAAVAVPAPAPPPSPSNQRQSMTLPVPIPLDPKSRSSYTQSAALSQQANALLRSLAMHSESAHEEVGDGPSMEDLYSSPSSL